MKITKSKSKAQEITLKDICRFWTKVNVLTEDNCWIWRGCIDKGNGKFSLTCGKTLTAHKFSYIIYNDLLLLGKLNSNDDYVYHTCGKQHCVNYFHLTLNVKSQKTKKDFDFYKLRGEKNSQSKLTNKQAHAIKYREKEKTSVIAKKYNVAERTIQAIKAGSRWKHI